MNKNELRQQAIARLSELEGTKHKRQQVEAIYQRLLESSEWKNATSIGVTISTGIEFPTNLLIRVAMAQGKKVAIPKSLSDRKLEFHWIDAATEFETTAFGVDEPLVDNVAPAEAIDLMIVPGLVYQSSGYRIGFGGGFYDRYLAHYPGKTISLVFFEQLVENWQPEAFDIKIQQLIIGQEEQ